MYYETPTVCVFACQTLLFLPPRIYFVENFVQTLTNRSLDLGFITHKKRELAKVPSSVSVPRAPKRGYRGDLYPLERPCQGLTRLWDNVLPRAHAW